MIQGIEWTSIVPVLIWTCIETEFLMLKFHNWIYNIKLNGYCSRTGTRTILEKIIIVDLVATETIKTGAINTNYINEGYKVLT